MRAAKPDSRNRRIDLHDSLSVAEHLAPEGKLDGFYVGDAVTVLILGQERLRFAIEDLDLIVRQGTQCQGRSEEHTSELQSLMRISIAVFCLIKNTKHYETEH